MRTEDSVVQGSATVGVRAFPNAKQQIPASRIRCMADVLLAVGYTEEQVRNVDFDAASNDIRLDNQKVMSLDQPVVAGQEVLIMKAVIGN